MEDKSKSVSASGFLDITQVSNEDLDKLAQNIESFYRQDGTIKTRLSYNWDRNHKFVDGNQWITFDGDLDTGGVWRRLTVAKANEYIPRPVTNYIFDAYQTLKSYLTKNKPRSTVRPNTQTFRDRMAAKIAELVLETNWERLKEAQNYEYAAGCALIYGTVFKKTYWDSTVASMAKIPRMETRPQTDPQTGQVIGQEEVPAIDPMTGEQIFDEIPLGDINTDIVEPYRIALDPSANDIHKIKWIMEFSIQSLDWVKEVYGKQGDGYTGKVDELKEETALSGSMRRFYQLKNSSGVKGNSAIAEGSSSNSGDVSLSNQVVLKEYYERPSVKYPKGRLVVVANNVTLYAGESPYQGPDLGDWHPYSEFRWEIVPGRFWGKSPLDNGVEIQKQINSIDAVIVLTRKTMAIPQKLVPLSAGIAPGYWTGRPGLEVPYRDSGGAAPSTIPAQGVDATVFQERAQRVDDLKTVMGNMDILKGDRPPGVTAASALNLLYEVGTGKLYPALERWKTFVENDQKKGLKLISHKYKEPRPEFIKMLRAKNSELSEQSISQFIGTDLYDNCNVIVEAGSNIPKLQAAKQAALQEAAQMGVLALEQPANRMEFLRQMGITGFDSDIGPDTKRQEWENALMDNIEFSPDNKPIVLDADNDQIHIEIMDRRMKEQSFMDLSPVVHQAYMQHKMEHMQAMNQKMMAQQAEQMAQMQAGMPPSQGGGPQPAPSPTKPEESPGVRGKGAAPSKDVKDALKQDMIVPGQLGG